MMQKEMSIEDYRAMLKEKKNKYGAKTSEMDGFIFASRAEARRYAELKLLTQAGEITNLQLQTPYQLNINNVHIAVYIADFVYRDANGTLVVEDVKGVRTREYKIKKKLMQALHKITILETR
jgi:hypothetical protein